MILHLKMRISDGEIFHIRLLPLFGFIFIKINKPLTQIYLFYGFYFVHMCSATSMETRTCAPRMEGLPRDVAQRRGGQRYRDDSLRPRIFEYCFFSIFMNVLEASEALLCECCRASISSCDSSETQPLR